MNKGIIGTGPKIELIYSSDKASLHCFKSPSNSKPEHHAHLFDTVLLR